MQVVDQKHTASTEAFYLGIGVKSKRNPELTMGWMSTDY